MGNKVNARKKSERAERRFQRVVKSTKDSTKDDDIYPQTFLDSLMKELKDAHLTAEEETEAYRELLDSDDDAEKDLAKNVDAKLEKMQDDLSGATSQIAKLSSKIQPKPAESSTKKADANMIKFQKVDPPKFSGDTRSFPAFISHYTKHIETQYGKDPFILMGCLSGDAEKLVRPVEEDYQEMMKRLQAKYGSDEKQVDVILHDLRSLKRISDGDYRALYKMIETVENCWLDLKRMNLQSEMDTTSMLSTIEKLLPEVQKREWTLQKPENSKFSKLLDFLIKEKNAIEYMSDEIRCDKGSHKTKVHHTEFDSETDQPVQPVQKEDDKQSVVINLLEKQMESQRQLMEMVVNSLNLNRGGASTIPQNSFNSPAGGGGNRCWIHRTNGHCITECNTFAAMTSSEKVDAVRKFRACFGCLQTGHASRQCLTKKPCEQALDGNRKCQGFHHVLLHAASVEGIIHHNAVYIVNARNNGIICTALLMISTVRCKGYDLGTLWDSGANVTLITHYAAQRMNLKGTDVFITITKVGNESHSAASKEYIVPLIDKNQKQWSIRAIGMDEITSEISAVDVSRVASLFRGVTENDIKRPTGRIELLIASDCCTLLPNKVQQSGNLQLMSNQFGYCLRGTHPLLNVPGNESNHVSITLNHVTAAVRGAEIFVEGQESVHTNMQEFFNIEHLGTCCAPKCGTCDCGKWSNKHKNLTIEQVKELKIVEDSLSYDSEGQQWISDYPWIRDPNELPNNYTQARYHMNSLERHLMRCGLLHIYNKAIADMRTRGVARKIGSTELATHDGPVFYIPHHGVKKPDSDDIRVVMNSSISFMGHVLNEYWAKGPDVINSLVGVILKFRAELYAFAGDISKMYNAVKTTPLVQHTHRILWQDGDTTREPDQYALTTVTFGDKPGGSIATVAMRKTAEMSETTHPRESDIIQNESYVDDILSSVSEESEVLNLTTGIDAVLKKGNFIVKHWVTNADLSEFPESKKGNILLSTSPEKRLGIWWCTDTDKLFFKIKLNFSKKNQNGEFTSSDLTLEDFDELFPLFLTLRIVLSQVSKLFDPLGFLIPLLLLAKILLRKSCSKNSENKSLKWDEALPSELYNQWKQFFRKLLSAEKLTFARCLRPRVSIGEPVLVVYDDGSKEAFGACAYARWEVGGNCFWARLIMAKNRIGPARIITIPRMELCGAVIAVRLRQTIEEELKWKFCHVMHITDSTIVFGQIHCESHQYKTFEGNRISEIQTKSNISEWYWAPSEANPADTCHRSRGSGGRICLAEWS